MNKNKSKAPVELPDSYKFTFITLRPASNHLVRTLAELNRYLAVVGHKPVKTVEELESRYTENCIFDITNDIWERIESSADQNLALISALTDPIDEGKLVIDSLCGICGRGRVNGVCPRGKDRYHLELLGTYDEEEWLDDFAEVMGMVRERGFQRATFAHILLDLYGWTPEQAISHIEALDAQYEVAA